jgi:2-(1,2-epoxy-1,2-dihydrophenyl)acetyl-CoA isomerase
MGLEVAPRPSHYSREEDPMAEPHLLSDETDGIATLTFNRPSALNALSEEMMQGLIDATARYERDPSIRCLVLRGAGDAFMAGGDVKGMHRALTADRAAYVAAMEPHIIRAHQFIYQLRRMPKPVLASIHGAVAGIGVSFAVACDVAIASDDAVFTLAYRHVGLPADGGSTYFLPRIVGERKALELAFLGERFSASKALELGLVNWMVPRAQLADETAKLALRLADGPTVALGLVKRLVRSSLESSWDEQSHREAELFAVAAATDDHLEGVTAFVEKRKPVFKGR